MKRAADGGGQDFSRDFLDLFRGLAESEFRLEVEADRDGGHLAEVGDGERADGRAQLGDGLQRDEFAFAISQVEQGERSGVAEVFLLQLKNDGVLVGGGVNRGNLPRAKRAVEGLLNLLGVEAERGRFVAVDVDDQLRAGDLQVGADVDDSGHFAHALQDQRGGAVEFLQIGAVKRVLINGGRTARAESDAGRHGREDADAGNTRGGGAELLGDFGGGQAVGIDQADEHAPGVAGATAPAI